MSAASMHDGKRADISFRSSLALGSAACFTWHWIELVLRDEVHDLLWICNVAGPALTLGCALGQRTWIAVPLLWLTFGTPIWLLDVFGGGEIIVSSFASHFGGIAIAVIGARRFGWPKRAWWGAAMGLVTVMIACRAFTPPAANVNLVFAVWPGWEHLFPSYFVYFALLFAGSALTFFVSDKIYARVLGGRAASSARKPVTQDPG